jgi:hypothetical protein
VKLTARRVVPLVGLLVVVAASSWLLVATTTSGVDSFVACQVAGYPVTDTNPQTCSDGRHAYVGPFASMSPVAARQSVPFELLVDGDSGAAYPRGQEVVRTTGEWQAYWRRVHAQQPELPPLIPVDFTRSSVIALSEGQQLTGGYSVRVTGITAGDKGTTVDVTETVPGPKCSVTQSVTDRYFIVRADGAIPDPVSFRATKVTRSC